MRVALVLTLIVIGALYSWKGPFPALLFYLWIAYFRPDWWVGYSALIWQLNLSYFVGLFLLISTIVTGQRYRLGVGPLLLALFLAQSLLSVVLSTQFLYSWVFWKMFAPALLTSYLIIVLVTNEDRLRQVFMVISLSLAVEGAKQGWLQLILNPGGENFNEHAMLGDNNGVAVGMFMTVPVLVMLARTASNKGERWMHRFLALGVLYRAVVTYSRGGFLSCIALTLHYLARSKRRAPAIIGILVAVLLIVPVLPDAFWTRMQTLRAAPENLETGEADASIQGRLHFWEVALVMAQDQPLTGVGFNAYNIAYDRYDFSNGRFGRGRSVHSVWLGALAEMGVPGLLLLMLLVGFSFRACWRARRLAKRRPDCQNLGLYATAIEAALLVFTIGGTFVIFLNEMIFHFVALAIVLDRLVTERERASIPEAHPAGLAAWRAPKALPAAAAASASRGLVRGV